MERKDGNWQADKKDNRNPGGGANPGPGTGDTPAPPKSAAETPGEGSSGIVLGKISAWRMWEVDGNRLQPMSYKRYGHWTPGKNTASYVPYHPDEAKPFWAEFTGTGYSQVDYERALAALHGAFAGFYCRKDRKMLNGTPMHVVGKVKIWGTIVEHAEGYRAEFAEVESLEYGLTRKERKALAETYNCRYVSHINDWPWTNSFFFGWLILFGIAMVNLIYQALVTILQ